MIHRMDYSDARGDIQDFTWESEYSYKCERCGSSLLEDVDITGYLNDKKSWESPDDYVQSEVGDMCSWCARMFEKLQKE